MKTNENNLEPRETFDLREENHASYPSTKPKNHSRR